MILCPRHDSGIRTAARHPIGLNRSMRRPTRDQSTTRIRGCFASVSHQIRANSRKFAPVSRVSRAVFRKIRASFALFRATSHLLQLRPFLVDKRFVEGQDGVPRVSNLQNLEISRWQSFLWGCGGNSRAQNATARRYEDIRAAVRGLRSQFRASFALVSR